jgi:hypothetical protein
MSQTSRLIFGAAAIALTLGAIPLAAGRDLSGGVFDRLQATTSGTQAAAINRAAKADRAGNAAQSAVPTQTISVKFDELADTSVLIRVPVAQAARPSSFAPSWTTSGDKRKVACESVVSVLTEVAKQLQPGRCVT